MTRRIACLAVFLICGARFTHAAPLAASVESESLQVTLRQLTGAALTPLADSLVAIETRFSPTLGYDRAARLVGGKCSAWGYSVARDYFLPSTLTAISFGDSRAWLTGLQVTAGSLTLASSSDHGVTWTSPASFPAVSNLFATIAGGGDTVIVAGVTVAGDSGAVAWSADAGASWVTRVTGAGAVLALARRGRTVWACGEAGTLLRSDDTGLTWTAEISPVPGTLWGMAAADDSTVWAVGDAGAVLRRDARDGAWHVVPLGFVDALRAVTFADARHGWIVGTNGITTRTTDGGRTWTATGLGNTILTTVTARDSLHVYAAGFVGAFRRSDDGGAHWSAVASGSTGDMYAVALSGATGDSLWLCGRQRLAVSLDEGGTWDVRNASIQSAWFNVIATRAGTQPGAGAVVLCGHLDSHSETPWTVAPGADDNASGSALLLEAARVLAGPSTPRSLQIVWFGGEEDGLLGSTSRAAAQRAAGDSLALLIDNDEVGRGTSITLYGNTRSAGDLDSIAAIAAREVPGLPLIATVDPTYRGSDQAPYWDQGYRAVSFVESAWRDNHDIESTRDSLGAVDTSLVARLARVVVAAAGAYLSPAETSARNGAPDAPDATDGAAPVVRGIEARGRVWRARLDAPRRARVALSLYRIDGRCLARSAARTVEPGRHAIDFSPAISPQASGMYLWFLDATDTDTGVRYTATGRFVAIR